jgi:penicillin-binding protein 1A
VAEAAMLAGLPKAPSAYNPISNPKRARIRQLYIIERMEENGFITAAQADEARKRRCTSAGPDNSRVHAEYVAEMARQLIFAQYAEAYTRGLNVYTTINAADQDAAYRPAQGHHGLRAPPGLPRPRKFITCRQPEELDDAIDDALADHPDNGDVLAAVVLEATPKKITACADGDSIEITGEA